MRIVVIVVVLASVLACGESSDSPPRQKAQSPAPAGPDAQHQDVTGPHGDHTPHHGGMVLMNGDIHYEVVLRHDGQHEVWFTDAMRSELPASVASGVTLEFARPGVGTESVPLSINDTGEAWVGRAGPIATDNSQAVMVKVRYSLQGEPHEIELPFVAATSPPQR